ncbi:MAG TPA: hypothetical protein PK819_02140 [Thermomicrobiales bacterium]|nr:hypothetical protein [Thermomicrobiales bacterium]
MRFTTPAAFATEPALDASVVMGYEQWLDVARERGPIAVTQWLERRSFEGEFAFHMMFAAVERLLKQADQGSLRTVAPTLKDLAIRLQPTDPEMAELFWQPVATHAMAQNDFLTLKDAATAITGILREFDEPQGIAIFWWRVLAWTREDGRVAPVDLIATGFEELIAAASMDGQQVLAAQLEFQYVTLHKALGETDIATGDWMPGKPPIALWFPIEPMA